MIFALIFVGSAGCTKTMQVFLDTFAEMIARNEHVALF